MGRTEKVQNCLNPKFAKKFTIDYYFEIVQKLKFGIYDIDNKTIDLNDDDFLGELECTLGQVRGYLISALMNFYPVSQILWMFYVYILFCPLWMQVPEAKILLHHKHSHISSISITSTACKVSLALKWGIQLVDHGQILNDIFFNKSTKLHVFQYLKEFLV